MFQDATDNLDLIVSSLDTFGWFDQLNMFLPLIFFHTPPLTGSLEFMKGSKTSHNRLSFGVALKD